VIQNSSLFPLLWAQFYSYSALASMQRGSFVGKGWIKRRLIESKWLTVESAKHFSEGSNVSSAEALSLRLKRNISAIGRGWNGDSTRDEAIFDVEWGDVAAGDYEVVRGAGAVVE
jgi:hypothetical protein